MADQVICHKFARPCSYLTEGKAYDVVEWLNRYCAQVEGDNGEEIWLLIAAPEDTIPFPDAHTGGMWKRVETTQ